MPAPPVSRLILLLSGSGLSLRVLGQLPYPVSLGAYTGDVIQLVSLHTNHQPQYLVNFSVTHVHLPYIVYYSTCCTYCQGIFILIIRIILQKRKQLFRLLSCLLFAFLRHLIRYALYFHISLFITSLLPFCDLAGTHDR